MNVGHCWSYVDVISLALMACGAQGNLGYIKKEKHTVAGKQNASLCERVCVRNELSFRTFGSGFSWFPRTLKMIFSEPGNQPGRSWNFGWRSFTKMWTSSEKGGGNLTGKPFWTVQQTKQGYHGNASTVYINKGFPDKHTSFLIILNPQGPLLFLCS